MHRKALEIAEEHFRRVNPSMWDGTGEPPENFVNHRITYSVNRYTELDISFERNNAGDWQHCCKLRDTLTDNMLAVKYGPGINLPQQLVDTILEICKKIGGIHMDYAHLKSIFQELKRTSSNEDLTAHIIFTEDSFAKPYSLLSRTYRVSSDNKAFWPNMGGYSIFAYCLDGTDQGVRLDRYMEEEGNPSGWKVETCYILERMRDTAAIPRAARTEQADGTVCYFFGDTTIRVHESCENGKFRLEPVAGDQVNIDGWVDLDIDRVYGYCTLLERQLNKEAAHEQEGQE